MMGKSPKFIQVEIQSIADLRRIFDILHDALILEEDIRFDPVGKTFDMWFLREFLEDNQFIDKKKMLFVTKYTYPLVRCHLHLKNVNGFEKKSTDGALQRHTFNEATIVGGKCTLEFCEVLKITFDFDSDVLRGKFEDLEITKDKKRSFYKFG